jgi:hypothetical protein
LLSKSTSSCVKSALKSETAARTMLAMVAVAYTMRLDGIVGAPRSSHSVTARPNKLYELNRCLGP